MEKAKKMAKTSTAGSTAKKVKSKPIIDEYESEDQEEEEIMPTPKKRGSLPFPSKPPIEIANPKSTPPAKAPSTTKKAAPPPKAKTPTPTAAESKKQTPAAKKAASTSGTKATKPVAKEASTPKAAASKQPSVQKGAAKKGLGGSTAGTSVTSTTPKAKTSTEQSTKSEIISPRSSAPKRKAAIIAEVKSFEFDDDDDDLEEEIMPIPKKRKPTAKAEAKPKAAKEATPKQPSSALANTSKPTETPSPTVVADESKKRGRKR